jgi:hypothetical protein
MTTGQTPALTTDLERLRAAALLVGLAEAEAAALIAAVASGSVQILAGGEPDEYQVLTGDASALPVLAWASAHSDPDTIVLVWDGLRWHACFASQRSADQPPLGSDETYTGAMVALLDAADRHISLGIPPGTAPEAVYQLLVERGSIMLLPDPYTLLALEEAWNGV